MWWRISFNKSLGVFIIVFENRSCQFASMNIEKGCVITTEDSRKGVCNNFITLPSVYGTRVGECLVYIGKCRNKKKYFISIRYNFTINDSDVYKCLIMETFCNLTWFRRKIKKTLGIQSIANILNISGSQLRYWNFTFYI